MRQLNCYICGKMLIKLEKGVIAKQGVKVKCVHHKEDNTQEYTMSEIFKSFGKK